MSADSCRAVNGEVKNHAPVGAEDRGPDQAQQQAPTSTIGSGQEAFFQSMANMIRQLIGAIPQAPSAPVSYGSPLEKIRKYGAEDFKGKEDNGPSAAEYWLENAQRILQQLHCTPEEKLECAVSLLKEEAYQWWDTVSHIVQPS
ncbi:uncharacterized protein LOC105795045 [Gossypium raimondii]|uniref:uncharacterized protein LOC105795045 n=1 Tax=Gossypium raimondii TaxID=29730 RepID=UPI00063AF2BD|nr:uncharacterized protein LOC105795045 [Gossypium raimondii]XP_052484586.1 uncharacterized protein LOC105795045 [Gossypium raimondii]